MNNIIGSINCLVRSLFSTELAFRFYVVFQLLGIAAIIYIDVVSSWDFFPTYIPADPQSVYEKSIGITYGDSGYEDPSATWHINWDFLHGYYWDSSGKNWFVLLALFGPLLTIKSIDWVVASKEGGKRK